MARGYAAMSNEMPITYFRMGQERFKVRKPRTLTAGLVQSGEAFLVLDTDKMRPDFQRWLFHHIQEGHIKVQVAEVTHE